MEGNDRLSIYHKYRIQTFASLLYDYFNNEKISVLDYGCGDGVISQYFVGGYVGIDPSEEMIRLAREQYSESTFICGGLEKLEESLTNSQPDLLVCLNTLPYMDSQEQDKFFSLASQYHIPVIVSHTNELLDLSSFNRYTVEHRNILLGKSEGLKEQLHQFNEVLAFPEMPKPVPQTEVRFGETKLNTSERDTISKCRVDPFTWPQEIGEQYGFSVKDVQPIRIFALPPNIMESDEVAFSLLHSDYFDFLPTTYKFIFCSQFRVVFLPV